MKTVCSAMFASPINSAGFFSMKFSHSLMNIAVVSFEGHSPWLNKSKDKAACYCQINHNSYLVQHITNKLLPSTLKLHIIHAFSFNVVAVIKASCVCQINK